MRRLFDKVLVETINESGNNGKGKKKAVSANTVTSSYLPLKRLELQQE
jgi:hypothetical protein